MSSLLPTTSADATSILDAWLDFAVYPPEYRRSLIGRTEIDYGRLHSMPVGDDHLTRRWLVPRVEDAIEQVMMVLQLDEYDTQVQHVQSLLAPNTMRGGEPKLFSAIVNKLAPRHPSQHLSILDEMMWSEHGYALVATRLDVLVELLTHVIGHLIPLPGASHPALPIEIVPALARILSGTCTYPEMPNGAWQIRSGTDDLGVIRPDASIGPPRQTKFAQNLSPREFDALGSRQAHKFLREMVARGWEALLRKDAEPGRIVLDGGLSKLARDLGIKSGDSQQQFRLAARLMGLVDLRAGSGTPAQLLRLNDVSAATGRGQERGRCLAAKPAPPWARHAQAQGLGSIPRTTPGCPAPGHEHEAVRESL